MPTKKKPAAATKTELPSIPKELINQFVKASMSAEAIQDASMSFKKALIGRAFNAELTTTLAILGARSAQRSRATSAAASSKTVLTDDGPLRLDIPKDRDGALCRF